MNINVMDDLFGVFFTDGNNKQEFCHLNWNLGFIPCISIMLRDMLTNLIVDKHRGCRYSFRCS